jgi:hypothetical protein
VKLSEHRVLANDVRLPKIAEGEAVVVGRYDHGRPKAVVLHPADYARLRELAVIVGELETPAPLSEGALEARELEDRPRDDRLVEDSATLAELLGL